MPAPAKNEDLHGNVPDKSDVALLIIDVINDLEFEGGDRLLPQALEAARQIVALKRRVKAAGIPVIYVNDNFGKWQSDLQKLIAHCLEGGVRGEPIVRLLEPDEDDYFVLKPKHSGFFSTTLDTLLAYLKAKTLILAGLTGDRCVLFTASDAFMRDYILIIPADCTASIDQEDNAYALRQMAKILHADITTSADLDLDDLKRRSSASAGEPKHEVAA